MSPSSTCATFPMMNQKIVCKATSWFLFRATAILMMFTTFAVLFFVDAKWGYREKNLAFFVSQAFQKAFQEFKQKKDLMSPDEWRTYAARQRIDFIQPGAGGGPTEVMPVPENTPVPLPWPPVLGDYERLEDAVNQTSEKLFDDYRLTAGIRKDAPDHPFEARKIFEQWVVFWICLTLAGGSLAILLRGLGRSMAIDNEAFYPTSGGRVAFADLVRLDLRKWDTKGVAFVYARTASGGERRLRIDGLVYGGFKPEQGQPAERLMGVLRENFTGELIAYATEHELIKQDARMTPNA